MNLHVVLDIKFHEGSQLRKIIERIIKNEAARTEEDLLMEVKRISIEYARLSEHNSDIVSIDYKEE